MITVRQQLISTIFISSVFIVDIDFTKALPHCFKMHLLTGTYMHTYRYIRPLNTNLAKVLSSISAFQNRYMYRSNGTLQDMQLQSIAEHMYVFSNYLLN